MSHKEERVSVDDQKVQQADPSVITLWDPHLDGRPAALPGLFFIEGGIRGCQRVPAATPLALDLSERERQSLSFSLCSPLPLDLLKRGLA